MSQRCAFTLALVAFALLGGTALAQTPDDGDSNLPQVCKKIQATQIAPPRLTGPLSAGQLSHCDETALYYGIGGKPNYPGALQCGWYQRAHPQPAVGNMFYGPGVLTMLYANGLGVARDTSLALRFACEQRWAASAEMQGRIDHLERLNNNAAATEPFDLCDDITSGLSMGSCTSIETRKGDAAREIKIAAIAAQLPAAARPAFAALRSAESAFEDARTGNEIDLSGTARAMFELEDQAKLRDQFLINLQRFAKGDIPAASPADLALLDKDLNAAYQQIQQAPASAWQYGTVKPEGIRATERTWLALVDAWLNFARVAYPGLSPARVRAQLIRLRLHQLRSLSPA